MSINRDKIVSFLDDTLKVREIDDSSNNGLQVAGKEKVVKVGLAVDACLETYEKAVNEKCDMLIVHHGMIWNGVKYVTGRDYKHISYLIKNNLNLYAAHLPLDAHSELGNNIGLARLMKLKGIKPFGEYHGINIGFMGELENVISVQTLAKKLQEELKATPVIFAFGKPNIKNMGIVSGGGDSALGEAIEKGIDCFITGEGNYSNYHLAKEAGINIIYLGHYQSETLGVKSLGRLLEKKFKIKTTFIDNPPKIA